MSLGAMVSSLSHDTSPASALAGEQVKKNGLPTEASLTTVRARR